MPQNNVLRPVLYPLCITNLPIALGSATAIYADDTAVLVIHNNHLEIYATTRKLLSHPEIAKKMENQS
jgi:hypothetical protein